MEASDTIDRAYEQFRRLAVGDPKRARDLLLQMIAGQDGTLAQMMEKASRASEGRVRQLVATTVRVDAIAKTALRPWLDRWLSVEADEFALRAIRDTLASEGPPPTPAATAELPKDFADTYRYVTERICHQVRNSLALPDTELLRLRQVTRTTEDEATRAVLTEILSGLQNGFERVARVVEFDVGDSYLAWSSIQLADWLYQAKVEFGQRYGPANLKVDGDAASQARVWAAPFLLDNIFTNLWSNAIRAAGVECEINVILTSAGRFLEALILDSGPGFSESARAAVFQAQYSTKATGGGRGLLEIAEAVGRLQGKVKLIKVDNVYRIQIVLPLEGV